LRQKLRKLVLQKDKRGRFKVLMRLVVILGFLWLATFPYAGSPIFTSENALEGKHLDTKFDGDTGAFSIYKEKQRQLELLRNPTNTKATLENQRQFLIEQLSKNFEVYNQDKYVYTYLRAVGGYGNECNIMSFPINLEASLAVALTFLELWTRLNPLWLSKDVVIVFYQENSFDENEDVNDYGEAMTEFLDRY